MYILIWNAMKIGEKQRTMLAQTQYSVLSASLRSVCVCVCVWCQASEFCTGHFTPN